MIECWVNVYQYNSLPHKRAYSHYILSKEVAIDYSMNRFHIGAKGKMLYRIHIKMDGGYSKPEGMEKYFYQWNKGGALSPMAMIRKRQSMINESCDKALVNFKYEDQGND